jgi:hypothetical protein
LFAKKRYSKEFSRLLMFEEVGIRLAVSNGGERVTFRSTDFFLPERAVIENAFNKPCYD